MTPTRPATLVVAGLACAVLTWLVLRLVYNSLPPLPWTGAPALGFVAVAVFQFPERTPAEPALEVALTLSVDVAEIVRLLGSIVVPLT